MLPEEQELLRLEGEQAELETAVAAEELVLETTKAETARFQKRYYESVGRLYVEIDELEARIAGVAAESSPEDEAALARAQAAQAQARQSAEEAGLIEALPAPPREITPELKQAYRQAAKLMHPDRATTEPERLRRNEIMAKVNRAYESGDQQAIEKLIVEFGQDPEAIAGPDVPSRIVKAIRRIAQLRRRLAELQQEMHTIKESEIFQLRQTIEEIEGMGGNPLADLAGQLMQELSELRIRLEMERHRMLV
jgi:hypothetical protein